MALTKEDNELIMARWAYDPRYMGVNAINCQNASQDRLIGDMQNSVGIVGNVKHRIQLAHDNGAELVINPMRHDDPFFSPSRIAVY